MPELPEVETLRRDLVELEDRVIRSMTVDDEMLLGGGLSPGRFAERVEGETIRNVERIGKYCLLKLEAATLLFSLRMTGNLIRREESGPERDRYVLFELDEGFLEFSSVRRFSNVHFYGTTDPEAIDKVEKLGRDPLHDGLSVEDVKPLLENRTAPIKTLLMNQELFAGLGNIYASEGCHTAGIDPRRGVQSLSESELDDLMEATTEVLEKAIGLGGSSISDFTSVDGENGSYQDHFFVYDREDEECRSCGGTIRRTELAGRSTFWCPECQQ